MSSADLPLDSADDDAALAKLPITTLYLVRHGATAANEQIPQVLQGSGWDLPLSDNGKSQADHAARQLAEYPIEQLYCSPMLRARQTAEPIGRLLNLPVQPVFGLQECDVGRWQGLDWVTIRTQHQAEYLAFQEDPARYPMPGGESLHDLQCRVVPIVERLICGHPGQSVVIVAHKLVLTVLFSRWRGDDLRSAGDLAIANGSIHRFEFVVSGSGCKCIGTAACI